MPAAEQVVRHQRRRSRERHARAGPEAVRGAPEPLADHLRVARDPHDARLPEVQLRLVDGGDLFWFCCVLLWRGA